MFVTFFRGRQDFHHYHEHTKHTLGGGVPRPMFAFPKFKNDTISEKCLFLLLLLFIYLLGREGVCKTRLFCPLVKLTIKKLKTNKFEFEPT